MSDIVGTDMPACVQVSRYQSYIIADNNQQPIFNSRLITNFIVYMNTLSQELLVFNDCFGFHRFNFAN